MKETQICILVTGHMLNPAITEVPGIKVIQVFGDETVVFEESSFNGVSMLVSGTEDAYRGWLGYYGGVLISSNPMMGSWEVMHVKTLPTIPLTRLNEFMAMIKLFPLNGRRFGQAFHDFLELEKVTSNKEWNDRLYSADDDTAKVMVKSVLDIHN